MPETTPLLFTDAVLVFELDQGEYAFGVPLPVNVIEPPIGTLVRPEMVGVTEENLSPLAEMFCDVAPVETRGIFPELIPLVDRFNRTKMFVLAIVPETGDKVSNEVKFVLFNENSKPVNGPICKVFVSASPETENV